MKNISKVFLGAFLGVFATLALVIGIASVSAHGNDAYESYGMMGNYGGYNYEMGPDMMYENGSPNVNPTIERNHLAQRNNYQNDYDYEMGPGMMRGYGGCW